MNKRNKWWMNGGRGSERTFRLLCEVYENKIAELQHKVDTLQGFLDHDIEYDMDKAIQNLKKENAELELKYLQATDEGTSFAHLKSLEHQLTNANLLLKDVYKIAMDDWNDPKWHDQVLRKAREYLKELEQ